MSPTSSARSVSAVTGAGPDDAKQLVELWFKDDGKARFLGDAPDAAVGVAFAKGGTAYVVVLLGTPR